MIFLEYILDFENKEISIFNDIGKNYAVFKNENGKICWMIKYDEESEHGN